jgi:hypothetical protein
MHKTERPSIALTEKPMFIWNLVPSASSFIFKIIDKETSLVILEQEINQINTVDDEQFKSEEFNANWQPPQCKTNGKFCVCSYPENAKSLQRKKSHVFTAITKNSHNEIISEFVTELIVIEEEAENATQVLQDMILDTGSDILTENWFRARELLSISGGIPEIDLSNPLVIVPMASPPIKPWKRGCLSASFIN